jgi:cysteinyl-tRNA synthetase
MTWMANMEDMDGKLGHGWQTWKTWMANRHGWQTVPSSGRHGWHPATAAPCSVLSQHQLQPDP